MSQSLFLSLQITFLDASFGLQATSCLLTTCYAFMLLYQFTVTIKFTLE